MNAKSEALTVKPTDLMEQIIQSTNDCGITINDKGSLGFQNFTGLAMLSKLIFDSGICPASMDSSKKVLVAIARGLSIGLDPFQSMESFYVVNGIAQLYGTAPLSLARQHPQWVEEGFDEWFEVGGKRISGHPKEWTDDVMAVCQTQRGKAAPKQKSFSVGDAKKAGLWNHPKKLYGVYPFRMLPARARGYAIQDNFGDSLKGIQIRETFDEEVDGNPPVKSGDELRGEMEKRMKSAKTFEVVNNRPQEVANNSSTIKEAIKQSFTHVELEPEQKAQLGEADLDISRDLLKGIYNRIPLKANPIECLKRASMEDGRWIGYEHINSISDLDYLNRISAKLEEYADAETAKAKAHLLQ